MTFKRIYLEITNMCNLNCHFCLPHHRLPKQLSVDEFTHIIAQIKTYTQYLYLHVKGEPLSHPHLATLLDICHDAGLVVNLTTNGTLIAQQQAMLLSKPALRQVNLSVHSFDQQSTHQQGRYLEDILQFAQKASVTNSCYINLRLWNGVDNQLDQQTQGLLATIMNYFGHNDQSHFNHLQANNNFTLAKHVFLSLDNQFIWPSLENEWVGTNGTCYGLRTQLGILSDGTVVPCCLDGDGQCRLGNIFSQSFADIVNSDRFNQMKQGFLNKQIIADLCQYCHYRTRFNQ